MPQVPALQARAGKAIDMGHVAASGAMARRLILEIVGNAIVGGQETYVTRLILEGNDNATSVKPGNDRPKPQWNSGRGAPDHDQVDSRSPTDGVLANLVRARAGAQGYLRARCHWQRTRRPTPYRLPRKPSHGLYLL